METLGTATYENHQVELKYENGDLVIRRDGSVTMETYGSIFSKKTVRETVESILANKEFTGIKFTKTIMDSYPDLFECEHKVNTVTLNIETLRFSADEEPYEAGTQEPVSFEDEVLIESLSVNFSAVYCKSCKSVIIYDMEGNEVFIGKGD